MHHVPLPPTQLVLTLSMSSSEILLSDRWSETRGALLPGVVCQRNARPNAQRGAGARSGEALAARRGLPPACRRTFIPAARGLLSSPSEDMVDCASSPRGAAYARGVRRSLRSRASSRGLEAARH
jgi:hypothetical protein